MSMSGGIYLAYLVLYLGSLPFLVLMLVSSLAAIVFWKTGPRTKPAAPQPAPGGRRFLVVIPAQNEQASISETVLSCLSVHYPRSSFEVLVIADNCNDDTALLARQAGARVLERSDPTRKSKGHALEYLINWLDHSGELDALDALVIVDADSTVQANLLEQFATGLDRGSDWMQCYDSVGNSDRSWRTRLMAHGFSLFNGITLAGRQALGLSASLRGNGMCLSTRGLRRVPWHAHGLVEDLEYSWTVRISGGRIDFIKDATVFATMLSKGGTSLANQRRRWEFGRSTLRRHLLGPLLKSPHLGWRQKTLDAIELASPPTSHLVLVYFILTGLAAFAIRGMIANSQFFALASICTLHFFATLTLVIHALSPFLTSLLPWRFALSLGYFPYYVVWKFFVMAGGGPDRWIRTQRECDQPPAESTHAAKLDGIVSEAVAQPNEART